MARHVCRRLMATLPMPTSPGFCSKLYSLQRATFGQPAEELAAAALARTRLAIVGELHAMPPVVAFERSTAEAMLSNTSGQLHIVLEHFSFEMQPLLNDYAVGAIDFHALLAGYDAIGTEGHDVPAYEPLLRLALEHSGRVVLHGGFIPRTYARQLMREGLDAALDAAKANDYVAADETCTATEAHYNFFESLISGRDPHGALPPSDRFRKMFPAQVCLLGLSAPTALDAGHVSLRLALPWSFDGLPQVIKDAAMAHLVNGLVARIPGDDQVLVICGIGHSGYARTTTKHDHPTSTITTTKHDHTTSTITTTKHDHRDTPSPDRREQHEHAHRPAHDHRQRPSYARTHERTHSAGSSALTLGSMPPPSALRVTPTLAPHQHRDIRDAAAMTERIFATDCH